MRLGQPKDLTQDFKTKTLLLKGATTKINKIQVSGAGLWIESYVKKQKKQLIIKICLNVMSF